MRKPSSAEWLADDVRRLVLEHIHGSTHAANVNALVEKIVQMIEAENAKVPMPAQEA